MFTQKQRIHADFNRFYRYKTDGKVTDPMFRKVFEIFCVTLYPLGDFSIEGLIKNWTGFDMFEHARTFLTIDVSY